MFAIVANGLSTICRTQRQLDTFLAIYPYPKFRKCKTEEDARKWLRENSRKYSAFKIENYGNTSIKGFVEIEYFISGGNAYYNIHTNKAGFIKIKAYDSVIVDNRYNLIKVKICDVKLDNSLILHHIIAIRRIFKLLGDFIDVNMIVPDISIYLALTKYSGSSYLIRGVQNDISKRLGGVAITVKESF